MALIVMAALAGCSPGRGAPEPSGEERSAAAPGSARGAAAPPVNGTPAAGAERTVLFLGTSLTAGLGLDPDSAYPAVIARKIDSAGLAVRVANGGVSGETAAGLRRRLDWVLQQPAEVIVVETGANDGLRGHSVEETRRTIGEVLDRIRTQRPDAKVFLVQMEAPPNMGRRYTSAFHALYPALAREKGVTLLPFLLEGVAGVPSLNQADGIHPNAAGARIVAETVWRGIAPAVRGR